MAIQKKNSSIVVNQFGGLYQALSSQSIVDVFVVQGIISPSDGEKIKLKYKNNLAVERFLLANRLISREAINKAYSIILKLPFIALKNLEISEEITRLIPEKVGKKFQVIPFSKKNMVVNLAIGNPGELFISQNRGLEEMFLSKNFSIELFVSTPSDVLGAWTQGKSKNKLLLEKTKLPVIFLRNRNVNLKYLELLPFEFMLKNRMAIFDQAGEKMYRIALEDSLNPNTGKIVEYLKVNNNLDFEEFSTSKDDIDYLLSLYKKQPDKSDRNDKTNEKIEEPGVFSGFVESLITQQPAGLVSKETLEAKNNLTTDQSSGNKVGIKEDEETKLEIEANREIQEMDRDIGKLLGKDVKTFDELMKISGEKSIPKLVAAIISYALFMGASDIHVEPEAKRLRVRYRVDGILKDILQLSTDIGPSVVSRIKILGLMKLDETRIPQDGRFSVNFMKREVDVRVSVLPTVYGEKTVMRILDKSQGILSLEDLGFVGSAFRIMTEQIKLPYGIILATGPTGSGKSTTLYAVLNRLNQPGVNVVTLEDPVEYEVPGVNQCQIKPKIGFTFAEGLRSILRQDPNIIMVGEVRDADTANMATHAALTGHLVLTTLHTNDAASSLPRLINMGVEPFLITSSVNVVIAQRLVRRVCPKCREKINIPSPLTEAIKKEIDLIPKGDKDDLARIKPLQFYRGKGCGECTEGYKGRIGIYELLVMNDEVESLAVSKRPASEIKELAVKSGMLTMRQDGILKAIDGLTTIDEVLLATGELSVGEITLTETEEDKSQGQDQSKSKEE
ncbi:MAG: type II/IV secretion system protein [Patescibacteria group bacterium]